MLSREPDGSYTLLFAAYSAGARAGQEAALVPEETITGIHASSMKAPLVKFKKGPVDPRLLGHSKGAKQILLERKVIEVSCGLNACCSSKQRQKRKSERGAAGIEKGESADVPLHAGTAQDPCCLEFLLSQQPDFLAQKNAIYAFT